MRSQKHNLIIKLKTFRDKLMNTLRIYGIKLSKNIKKNRFS
jgi:hypothetical protein